MYPGYFEKGAKQVRSAVSKISRFSSRYPGLFWIMTGILLLYLVQLSVRLFALDITLYRVLGLSRKDFFSNFAWYQPFTYMFLHSPKDILHPLMNLFILWMTGRELEPVLGRTKFTVFFFASGFFAGIVHIIFSPSYVIGASGSVFALLIVYALIWPEREILAFFVFRMKIKYFALLLMGLQILHVLQSTQKGISHFAHIGGAAGGLLLFLLYRKTGFFERVEQYNRDRRMRRHEQRIRKKAEEKDRVDEILDKISSSGLESLSRKERRFLDNAGKHLDLPPDE